jgi:hypothetical protein
LLPCLSTINIIRKDSRARMAVERCTSFNPVHPDKSRCGTLELCDVCLVQGTSTLITSFALCATFVLFSSLASIVSSFVSSHSSWRDCHGRLFASIGHANFTQLPRQNTIFQTKENIPNLSSFFLFINQPISPLHCIYGTLYHPSICEVPDTMRNVKDLIDKLRRQHH